MNLRHLHIFIMVAETGSMSKTGRKLYISQPAISQAILELEDELQIKLLDRTGKRLVLTYPGKILYNYGKKIFLLIDEAQNTLRDIANMKIGKLTVGASTTIGTYLLPRLVGDFKKKHPSVEISFTIANTHLIEDMVLNHHIDIGLVEGPIYAKEIVVKHFSDDELYLICSQDHRWAREGRLTVGWEEVAKDTLILREKGSGTREIVEKLMARHNLACQSTHILNNNEAIKRAVEANLGIALLPQMAVHEDIRNGRLVKVNIKDTQIMRRFDIIYHLDKFRSPLFDAFMQYLEMGKFEDRGLTQT